MPWVRHKWVDWWRLKFWMIIFSQWCSVGTSVSFPSSVIPSSLVENPCSIENGLMLPSLKLQLTSVFYSALHYLSHSILLLKTGPKNCPLSLFLQTHRQVLSVLTLSFFLSIFSASPWSSPGPPTKLPTLCAIPFQPAIYHPEPEWMLPCGNWINHLPVNFLCGFPLLTHFNPNSLAWVLRSCRCPVSSPAVLSLGQYV